MASANSNIQMTGLDFQDIKSNMIRFMQGQDTFKDYNFAGSGLSVLMDILAYNTQYNAYYLNMVSNEMFLDTALQRSSVVSQAKVLGYTPKSSIAPTATINVSVYGVTQSSLTIPKFTPFLSRAIDGVNYTFLTEDSITRNTVSGTVVFENVLIKQGTSSNYSFVVNATANPKFSFEIPDANIDTSTLTVSIQQSSVNLNTEVFNLASYYPTLDGNTKVYFLQEGLSGNYEIYFGNGVLGQKLIDGNIVRVSYISTKGTASHGANNFSLIQGIGGYANTTITSVTSASNGNEKESIESIKYQAPKSFSAQNRAVTKDDYITAIQQNKLGLTFDAVNVWGGEENDVPVFGQVFICLKPSGAYNITETQKQRLVQDVIKPIGVMTVNPTIVDPDYTYLKLNITVVYDPNKTTQTSAQIESGVKSAIYGFATSTLNTFNSTFNAYELMKTVQDYSNAIITSEYDLKLQKKFFPSLVTPSTYKLYYNASLDKGMFLSGVSSIPSVQFRDPANLVNIINGIYLEEVPSSTNGVESISLINPGSQYQSSPTITILGDGTGATAHAVLSGGSIKNIVIDSAGSGYTAALVTITPQASDTTGKLAAGIVNLEGKFGTLRTYYNNTNQVKTVLNPNIGTIDYMNGIVTLNSFGPIGVDNALGQFTVTVKPTTSIISSSYNRIITIDPYDANAVAVNVVAKS
jgi:hypothetical protein